MAPRPRRDPNLSFPGTRVSHGEHWTPSPIGDWYRHRIFNPDPKDELRVLGFVGANELAHTRAQIQNHLYNLAAAKAQRASGRPVKPLSSDEIARVYSEQAGLEPLLKQAAKQYTDIHHVPIPLPTIGGRGPGIGPIHALMYPTGARIGHLASLGPSWLETPHAAQWAATGKTSNPFMAGIEAASLFPLLRPIRGARALAVALGAAGRGAEFGAKIEAKLAPEEVRLLALARRNIAAGREISAAQRQVLNKVETRIGRAREVYRTGMQGPTAARLAVRKLRAGEGVVEIPGAKSRTGRMLENLGDVSRRAAQGRVPGLKSEQQRFFEELNRVEKYRARARGGKVVRLQQLARKLNDGMQYALRLSLEGSTPEEAISHHMALANAAETPEAQRVYHLQHAAYARQAERYLDVQPDGRVNLAADVPKALKEAHGLLVAVSRRRETDYKDIFALTDQQIMNRITGPKRVRLGARWQEAEAQLQQALAQSPLRQEARAHLEELVGRTIDNPERQRIAVEAGMHLWDAGFRNAAFRVHGDQREIQAMSDLLRFGRGPIPDEALTQPAVIGSKFYYDTILKGAPPEVLNELPQEGVTLGDLINAQRKAADLGAQEASDALRQEITHAMRNLGMLFQQRDIPINIGDPIAGQYYPFTSPVGAVVQSMPDKFGAQELMGRLKKAGVKDEEIKVAELPQFLETAGKSTTKDEVLAWLDEHYLQLQENVRYQHFPAAGEFTDPYGQAAGGSEAKFGQYALAGAQEPEAAYRELTIQLPEERYGQVYSYTSHFPEQNILAHVRFTDRTVNGKRGLLIEEIQSDWHQAGAKRGYRRPIEEHPDYAMRREALTQAAEDTRSIRRQLERHAYFDIHGNDLQDALHVNLRDAVSVDESRRELERVRQARNEDVHFVAEDQATGAGDRHQIVVSAPDRRGNWSRHGVAYYDTQTYHSEEIARLKALQEQEANRLNRLVDMPGADFADVLNKIDTLYRAMANEREKRRLMEALAADVQRGVPEAPFKKTWHELAFKRMLAWAVDHGYERLAWTTGKQQAERYDLGNFFSRLEISRGGAVGSDVYEQALEESRQSESYYDFLNEKVPPEPDRYDFYAEHEDPQQAQEAFDAAWSAWDDQRDEIVQAADESWDAQFAYDWERGQTDAQEVGGYDEWQVRGWTHEQTYATAAPSVDESVSDDNLEEAVGRDVAAAARKGQTHFEGGDLAFGDYGQSALGAKAFYDKKLTGFAQKYMKKYGVEVKAEKLGTRRVSKVYDAYYKPHASTVEAGNGHPSLGRAQLAIDQVIADSQMNPLYGVIDNQTGEFLQAPRFTSPERAQMEIDQFLSGDPALAGRAGFHVGMKTLSREDFQIVPREIEEWVGDPNVLPRLYIEKHPWRVMQEYPGRRPVELAYLNSEAEARDRLGIIRRQLQTDVRIRPFERGAPFGETVHSIELPSPSKPTWNDFIQYKATKGEPVGRHDPAALEEFQAWHPEQTQLQKDVASGLPLFQRNYRGAKGAIWNEGPAYATRAVINFSEHGDVTTFVHELFGHWLPRWVPENEYRSLALWAGGNFDPGRGEVDVQAAEKVANAMEAYIREGHGAMPVKQAVRSLSPYFREMYDGADLPDLTPRVREIFDRMFAYTKVKGGKLIGAEDIPNYSIARVPTQPGRPLPSGIRNVHHRMAATAQYILSGGKTIAKGPVDQALNHEYRGAALLSGYFTPEAIAPTTRDAMLATRITTIHRLREDLLKTAADLPTDEHNIAIKVNPDKTTPKGVKTILDKMREIDGKGGKLSRKDMEKLDFDILEEGGRDVFPNQLLDEHGEPIDIREWAKQALNRQEPIPNIKWIPSEWLDSSGLIPPPGWKGTALKTFSAPSKGMVAIDTFNDFNKLAILYLNPAYIPINLTGNLVMNLMHQGVFAPANLWRGALMHQWLDGWERKTIDNMMGNGLTASMALRTSPGQYVHSTLGFWINQAVDLIPRRAAWLHEARRAGYRSKEQVRELIRAAEGGDEQALKDAQAIAYRANDAIVDYERMSPLERQLTARLIFFYPWLKGASRYSMRFALEHPVQAVALMLAAEHAYTYQQQTLGAVPYYEAYDVPIATKSLGLQLGIPGIYNGKELADLSQVFGDHSWVTGKYPMVIDARQLFTFTTVLDIYRSGYGLVTGNANAPSFFDNLTPFLSNTITTLQGYDSFRHKEVPRSLGTWLSQAADIPQRQRWLELAPVAWGGLSDKQRREIQQNAINPRTKEEEWWRLVGSGLAPAPFSTEVAAKRTLSNAPTKVRHVVELKMDAHKYGLGGVSDQVIAQINEYDDMNHEIKAGMKPTEVLQIIAKYTQRHPELRHASDVDQMIARYATSDARAKNLADYLRHDLEFHAWGDYWRLRHEIARGKRAYERTHLSGAGS